MRALFLLALAACSVDVVEQPRGSGRITFVGLVGDCPDARVASGDVGYVDAGDAPAECGER